MTKYNKNKSPKGWVFPFNKKEIQSLIEETGAIFDCVNFENTRNPSEDFKDTMCCWLGVLNLEKINDEYHFSLKLNSFKEEYISPWKEQILSLVNTEVKKWVKWKMNQPLNTSEKPKQFFLRL